MSVHFEILLFFAVALLGIGLHGSLAGRKYRRNMAELAGVFKTATSAERGAWEREAEEHSSHPMSMWYMTIFGAILAWIVWWKLGLLGTGTYYWRELFISEFWYISVFPVLAGCVYALSHDVIYDMETGHDKHGSTWAIWAVMAVLGWAIGQAWWTITTIVMGVLAIWMIISDKLKSRSD